jgi:phosphonate transport system permease protein
VIADSPAVRRSIPRFEFKSPLEYMVWLLLLLVVVWSLQGTSPSFDGLSKAMGRLFAPSGMLVQMFPPDLTRLDRISWKLVETLQMAVAGVVLGLVFALPLAILAADGLSPHPIVRVLARALIAFFRTVPDLIWAIVFIIVIGLGPAAGVLAIMVDKIGFAGRFFAEAMEETDKGPREALAAIGASRIGIIASAVWPAAMPSFIATSLFAVEKAVRGSVALGLVGAGGIGVDLKVAFDLFDYDQALTIVLLIFLLVIGVEQASAWIRRRII